MTSHAHSASTGVVRTHGEALVQQYLGLEDGPGFVQNEKAPPPAEMQHPRNQTFLNSQDIQLLQSGSPTAGVTLSPTIAGHANATPEGRLVDNQALTPMISGRDAGTASVVAQTWDFPTDLFEVPQNAFDNHTQTSHLNTTITSTAPAEDAEMRESTEWLNIAASTGGSFGQDEDLSFQPEPLEPFFGDSFFGDDSFL